MAEAAEVAELVDEAGPPAAPPTFLQTPMGKNIALGVGISVVIALMTAIWLWYTAPEYKVLFSGLSDRDGGAITAALDQLQVKHRIEGSTILVPSEQVHDVRFKLASQGLPKGGNVGFELMDNQKLGISQNLEQLNVKRALEGELARSIQTVSTVSAARVHLALPDKSVFVREQQKPTASVVLTLQNNRTLELHQINAIIHLVASSVPDLTPGNVTLVDQNGNLLSDTSKQAGANKLDPNQLKYVQALQQNIVKQVESLIIPIVGQGNVRAEATADVDFATVDTAAESFKPNSPPEPQAIRSQQTSDVGNPNTVPAVGVPGALSNQPPGANAAPVQAPGANGQAAAPGTVTASGAAPGVTTRKDATTNFEVDKTIRYEQRGQGVIKRMSVGVVVNYKRLVDKATGKVTIKALTDAEKAQITELVKQAMGYDDKRGDTLNVSNVPFDGVDKPVEIPPPVPWWKDPENLALAKEGAKFLAAAIAMSYLFFRILRPMLRPIFRKLDELTTVPEPPPPPVVDEEEEAELIKASELEHMEANKAQGYRENLQMAKNLSKEDPRVVANVVKAWVGANE
ncbi:flagellar basal-body MS-ring/collar protein FliF [Massilia sp. TS11]|uniref:flagellar basal-body MS-ring/collar protein FliF n=1 Tax=Massilia sp. TS11 TaxID=2908003 RepID=UPI001EDAAD8D|nr:flagellar basal-body MS-ring/collar protein FliF [Massilia sp. TS11]MCG2582881.1 flagellar M-ring protein FliF [Massilia sp. TS11]